MPSYSELLSCARTKSNEEEEEISTEMNEERLECTKREEFAQQLCNQREVDILHQLKKLEEENKQLAMENAQLCSANMKLVEKNQQLKKENTNKNADTIAFDALQLVFTPGQVKQLMCSKEKRIKWSAEDISSAIALRSVSAKAYNYLREVKKIPLPCIQTLRNWSANFDVQPGILKDVLKIMHIKGRELPAIERLTVLCFDEIYISNKVDLEHRQQKIYGPYTKSQFIMTRSLFGKWKQPILYDFDQPMTKEILLDSISCLHKIGYTVVAVTSDLGSTNRSLWKSMDIGIEIQCAKKHATTELVAKKRCFFLHPSDENLKIFVFADAPHLIKLARNNFFDSGFIVDGQLLTKQILEELVALNSNELKIAFNLSKVHLDVKGNQRQSVKLAAQVFSNRNAKAIKFCGERGLLTNTNWRVMSKVISTFNDWFDVLNSQGKFGKHSGSRAYGVELQNQDIILNEMDNMITNMQIPKKKSMLPFQKGILLTNQSLRQLLQYLKETFSTEALTIEYIITRRLSQDVLENFFSYIRAMGSAHDHPSPVELQKRLKWYILGKHSAYTLSKNCNTDTDLLSANLMDIEDVHNGSCTSDLTDKDDDDLESEAKLFMQSDDIENSMIDMDVEEESDTEEGKHILYSTPSVDELTLLGEFEKLVAMETVETEALIYVAGYVAHRFRYKYPELGVPTATLQLRNDWLSYISRGNCIYPSKELQAAATLLDEEFVKFHGNTFSSECLIFDKLTTLICKKVSFPTTVIACLVRTRTYIRLRHMNALIKQRNCTRQKNKKMKHMCNKQC